MAPPQAPRTLLIACGALAREVLALRALYGWSHLELTCLPAKLHNRPQLIPQAVRAKIRRARAEGYERIFVVYGDCGTGGELDRVLEDEGVERIEGPHCYAFYRGLDAFLADPVPQNARAHADGTTDIGDRALLVEDHRHRVSAELGRVLRVPPDPGLLPAGHGLPPI